jgi:hypothetical protein
MKLASLPLPFLSGEFAVMSALSIGALSSIGFVLQAIFESSH